MDINCIKHLNCDIIYNIIKFSDYKSSKNFLLTCKYIYNEYDSHISYFYTLFLKQIFKHFHLKPKLLLSLNTYDKKSTSYITMNKIYNYFYYHNHSSIIDFIIFIIEHNENFCNNSKKRIEIDISSSNSKNSILKETSPIFSILIDMCKFNFFNPLSSKSVWNRQNISINDMKYILTYCNINQLNIILNKYPIHSSIIAYSIHEILEDHIKCKKFITAHKIQLLINYIFLKFCFNNKFNQIDNMYLHKILNSFIKSNQTNYFNYIFLKKNKYNISLEYQILLNDCIQFDNLNAFKIILEEYYQSSNDFANSNKKIPNYMISCDNLQYLCKKGSFEFVTYIYTDCLKNIMNTEIYINSIISGLKEYITLNKKTDYKILYKYISMSNQNKIEKDLKK